MEDTLLFAVDIDLHCEEEGDWLRRVYDYVPQEGETFGTKKGELFRELVLELGEDTWSFALTIDGQNAHIESEEYGNAYQAALLIHQFLKTWRPSGDDVLVLSYARTGSARSGGTYAISSKGVGMCLEDVQIEVAKMGLPR